MYTFIIALIALVVGFLTYGTLVEKVFCIDTKADTPAVSKQDGVDYVPLPAWRIFLIQFLNIAGLGPIFGAIMGIFYGPSAFLWIVLGTIFAGGVHDYLSGMMSLRKGGVSLPEIVGSELGMGVRQFMRLLSLVLLILLTTTFLSGPASLLHGLVESVSFKWWVLIIFGYYILATLLPVDKIIGQLYPLFGGVLLFMGIGIACVMLGGHASEMPELTDGLQNRQHNGLPLFPMMFVSIACGAISGFHGTQSPLMARCVTSERQGRWIFYGAMVAEGILALIWAAAAGTFFADPEQGLYGIDGLQAFAAAHSGENIAALVVDRVSRSWLGVVGGILAIIGVIAAPVTSGDTALRSARLIVADFLHLEQKTVWKRLAISLPLFALVFGMTYVNFDVVWRYFSWTNQTLAVFTLWAGTVFLYRQEHAQPAAGPRCGYLMAMVPAVFMTMVSASYILIAPEGMHLPAEYRWAGYLTAAAVTLVCVVLFGVWTRRYAKR
ncbi:MAG: carbon starvation protein A [Paludibacteraceae bacterium]|nr:carbon starvation protein A [Paludibacteraceae bacterium]MBQ9706232.1 carbon starvation protein A [Paludibacteraceae bacterium]